MMQIHILKHCVINYPPKIYYLLGTVITCAPLVVLSLYLKEAFFELPIDQKYTGCQPHVHHC